MDTESVSRPRNHHRLRRIPTRALVSYGIDVVLKVALFVSYMVIDQLVTPFAQHFSLDDVSIQYPYTKHERISLPLLILISAVCPFVIVALYVLFIDRCVSQRGSSLAHQLWELHSGCLGLLTAHGLAFTMTTTLKDLCGRPRPDLIARCLPLRGAVDGVPFGLVDKSICTQQDKSILNDGFRSFPSGHASSAFAGLFYLSLYMGAKLRIADQRGDFWRTLVVLAPVLSAACVCLTRIMDARHHGFDVLFGAALGIFSAWMAYRQYFPPIHQTWNKGRAYPVRTWGTPTAGRRGSGATSDADPEAADTWAAEKMQQDESKARTSEDETETNSLDERIMAKHAFFYRPQDDASGLDTRPSRAATLAAASMHSLSSVSTVVIETGDFAPVFDGIHDSV